MDFGALPPEINSAKMYLGPGSKPMLAAAAAWDQLAENLHSSAAAYNSAIATLTASDWQGPSAAKMADAAAPYVAWMHNTATHAEQTSTQAKVAAGAYHTAYSAMVPPALIAENRAELAQLVVTNLFGQNSPAIAAREAEYDGMWATDAAGMYNYAASSSTASSLSPFAGPPQTTNPAAAPAQTGQAAAAAANPTQLLSQLPTAMQATPPAMSGMPMLLSALLQTPSVASAAASVSSSSLSGSSIYTTNHALAVNALRDEAQGMGPFFAGTVPPAGPLAFGGGTAQAPSAAMGRASVVGTLSVPQSWTATVVPPDGPGTVSAARSGVSGAPTSAVTAREGIFGEALLGTLAGRGVSTVAAKMRRPGVVPRSPAAG